MNDFTHCPKCRQDMVNSVYDLHLIPIRKGGGCLGLKGLKDMAMDGLVRQAFENGKLYWVKFSRNS